MVVVAGDAELRLAVLVEREVLVPELLERLAVLVPVLVAREVLTPERLLLVLLLEREVLALEREVLELEREVLELERLAVLPERLLLELELLVERLMVPPCALELLDDELTELREELEEEELLDALEPEERLLLELELVVERLLLEPLLDWALTGAIASAIAAMAASAILNVVFIMLNFSVRKFNYSF